MRRSSTILGRTPRSSWRRAPRRQALHPLRQRPPRVEHVGQSEPVRAPSATAESLRRPNRRPRRPSRSLARAHSRLVGGARGPPDPRPMGRPPTSRREGWGHLPRRPVGLRPDHRHGGPSWRAAASPPARFGHDAAWAGGVGLVIFAGQAGTTFFDDLWAYDPAANAWRRQPVGGRRSDRPVRDVRRHRPGLPALDQPWLHLGRHPLLRYARLRVRVGHLDR